MMHQTMNHDTLKNFRSDTMNTSRTSCYVFAMLLIALLFSAAGQAMVTKITEELDELYDAGSHKNFAVGMSIGDNWNSSYMDFKGFYAAVGGVRVVQRKWEYDTSIEDWKLVAEKQITYRKQGLHTTPLGARIFVPGFIGTDNPFHLGDAMGPRTVGVDLGCDLVGTTVETGAKMGVGLRKKDGAVYYYDMDVDVGNGKNASTSSFNGRWPVRDQSGQPTGEYMTAAPGDSVVSHLNPRGIDPRIYNTNGNVISTDCCNPVVIIIIFDGGTGYEDPVEDGETCEDDTIIIIIIVIISISDNYNGIPIEAGCFAPPNMWTSNQPSVLGSSGGRENFGLQSYMTVGFNSSSINGTEYEGLRMYQGNNLVGTAKELESEDYQDQTHYQFGADGPTAHFIDNTTLEVRQTNGQIMAFNNLSNDYMRLAYSTLPDGSTVEYEYDGNSRLTAMRYPDNSSTQYSYTSGVLTRITKRNGEYYDFSLPPTGTQVVTHKTSGGTVLAKQGWEYDTTHPQVKAQYTYTGSDLGTAVKTAEYTFDATGTVVSASSQGIQQSLVAWPGEPAGSIKMTYSNGIDTITKETQKSYDGNNFRTVVKRIIAPNNEVVDSVTQVFSPLNTVEEVALRNGGTRTYTYRYEVDDASPAGLWKQVLGATDELGRRVEYTYPAATAADTLAWLPSEVRMYDANGRIAEIVGTVYDSRGDIVQHGSKDENGEWITQQQYAYSYHDRLGFDVPISTTDGSGRVARFVYDTTSRLTHSGIGAATNEFLYRASGDRFRDTSPEGNATTFDYYENGRLAAFGVESETTEYGYGRLHHGPRLTSVTDAQDQWIGYDFDLWHRLKARRFYGDDASPKASESYSYDAWGRIDSFTDCNGDKTTWDYDALGRVTGKSYLNGSEIVTASIAYSYDDQNQIQSVASYCGQGCADTVYYHYDKIGELTYRSGVGYGQVGIQRDGMGRPASLQWMQAPSEPTNLVYRYDLAQRVTSVAADGVLEPLASYGYSPDNIVDAVALENGTYVEYEYDSTYDRLNALRNRDKYGTSFAGVEYSYDLDGVVTRVDLEDSAYILYDYDPQYRLTDEWRKTSGNATIYRHQYQYDDAGNRTQHIHTDNVSNSTTFTLTYNDLNQLTQRGWNDGNNRREVYTYDDNGNLIQKDEDVEYGGYVTETRWEYSWDHENRLIEVIHSKESFMAGLSPWKKVRFNYCPSCGGNRTAKVVWENENWDMGGEASWVLMQWLRYETFGLDQLRIDERYDSDENGLDDGDAFRTERVTFNAPGDVGRIHKENLYTYPSPHSPANASVEEIYYHYDWMGNVVALSGSDGLLITGHRYSSDAFGTVGAPNLKTTRRLTAKHYDADVHLYDFGARWYDPWVGRFVSRDPFAAAELLEGPNLYVLDFSNPLMFIDLTGLSVGKPGFWEGLIPVWGSGREAIDDCQNGRYGWCAANAALAVSDVLGPGLLIKGGKIVGKGIGKAAGLIVAKKVGEAAGRGATRVGSYRIIKETVKEGEEVHHLAALFRGDSEVAQGVHAWYTKITGFNPDDFCTVVDESFHKFIHYGSGGGRWNDDIREFIRQHPRGVSKEEFEAFLLELFEYYRDLYGGYRL